MSQIWSNGGNKDESVPHDLQRLAHLVTGEVLDVRQLHTRCIITNSTCAGSRPGSARIALATAPDRQRSDEPRRSGSVCDKLVDVGPVTDEDGSARLSDRGRHDSGP